MLTSRYMATTKNVPAIMEAIVKGTAPTKFTVDHLKGLGFTSSNDRGIIPVLKDLHFLSEDGTPSPRYHQYRGNPRSVMAEALREAYQELFHINAKPTPSDRSAIEGKFKTAHGVSDRVAEQQAGTFLAFLKLADLDAEPSRGPKILENEPPAVVAPTPTATPTTGMNSLSLRYNIEVHLPATKDIEVYHAIFKALRENLAN